MTLIREIGENAPQFRLLRRDIHAHPELGYDVHRTADLVAQRLTHWGFAVTRGVGRTGLVATLGHGTGQRAIALRADMDVLLASATTTTLRGRRPPIWSAHRPGSFFARVGTLRAP